MSSVTSVIITGLFDEEEEKKALSHLNKFRPNEPVFLDISETPYAGTKSIECFMAVGGFNYLDLSAFAQWVVRLKTILGGDTFETVQVMFKKDHSHTWSFLQLN